MNKYIILTLLLPFLLFTASCTNYDDVINTLDDGTEVFLPENFFSNSSEFISGALDNRTDNAPQEITDEVTVPHDTIFIEAFETVDNEECVSLDSYITVTEDISSNVWIPTSGKKYHKNAECSNMKSPSNVLLSEAMSLGYEPCKRCYKQ